MKLIGYTVGTTKREQELQKAALHAQFPEATKIYSESCSRNGTTGKPTRQTRGHALMAARSSTILVTDKIERLGADEAEVAAICSALLDEGVHLVSIVDGVDTRNRSDFSVKLKAKLADLAITPEKSKQILDDARQLGARTRHVKMTEEELAALAKIKEEGGTGKDRQQLRQKLLAQHEARVLEMLNDGMGPLDIGKELGVDDATIRGIAKYHGLKIDRRFKNGVQGRILGVDDQKVIAQRLSTGERPSDLAREYGVSYDSVYRVYRVMNGSVKLKRYQNPGTISLAQTPSATV